jgi:hypothetical protein
MGRAVNGAAKRPVADWPASAMELCRGVNDTWNSYQRANKGRTVTTAEWKSARARLWEEYESLLRTDLVTDNPSERSLKNETSQMYALGTKRGMIQEESTAPDFSSVADPGEESSEWSYDEYTYDDFSDQIAKRAKVLSGEWETLDYCYPENEYSDSLVYGDHSFIGAADELALF